MSRLHLPSIFPYSPVPFTLLILIFSMRFPQVSIPVPLPQLAIVIPVCSHPCSRFLISMHRPHCSTTTPHVSHHMSSLASRVPNTPNVCVSATHHHAYIPSSQHVSRLLRIIIIPSTHQTIPSCTFIHTYIVQIAVTFSVALFMAFCNAMHSSNRSQRKRRVDTVHFSAPVSESEDIGRWHTTYDIRYRLRKGCMGNRRE